MTILAKSGAHVTNFKNKVNWSYVKKGLTLLLFTALAFLLISKARELDWQKIWATFRATEPTTLLFAFTLGVLCFTAYASYDLIGRRMYHINVSAPKTMLAAWISYACNLNLGAVIGSVALRFRLYSRLGVAASDVTRILSVSVFSNWMGYVLLAGILFVSGAFSPPQSWAIGATGFRVLGTAFILAVGAYMVACTVTKKREYNIRGHQIVLPRLPIVAWQLGTAAVHWTLMVLVMYQFFADDLSFATVYIALLVSSIAGAVSHVPGGLGVIEAVFVALLGSKMPHHEIIAGVFAYRCVFYFLPLAVALPLYLVFETVLADKPS